MTLLKNLSLASKRRSILALLALTGWLSAAACTPLTNCDATLSCGSEDEGGGEAGDSSGGRASSGGTTASGGLGLGGEEPSGGASDSAGGSEMGGQGGDEGAGGSDPLPTPGLELEGPVRLLLRTGSSVEVPFEVEVSGGFEEPLLLSMAGLPRGVLANSSAVPPATSSGVLTLVAALDAPTGGPFSIRLKATSVDGTLEETVDIELVVAGEAGTLDKSFGDDGVLRLDANAFAGLSVDTEGLTTIAYTLGNRGGTGSAIVRFDLGGQIDPTFVPPMNGRFGVYSGFAISGERIGLGVQHYAGVTNQNGVLLLDRDGPLAEDFAADGFASLTSVPRYLQSRVDGSIYAAAVPDAITLLTEKGEVDSGFAVYDGDCFDFVLDALDDRLFVGCSTETSLTLIRILEDGSLDESFASMGTLSVPLSSGDSLHTWRRPVVVDPSGGVLVVVNGDTPRLLRFDENGSPDLDFGTLGQMAISDAHENLDVCTLASGFLAFARETPESTGVFQLFDWSGQPITSFGTNGSIGLSNLGIPLEASPAYVVPWVHTEDDVRSRVVMAVQNGEYTSVVVRIWL